MRCTSPRVAAGMLTPCRSCIACRINKRREWTHRILLESYTHKENTFVTLTYADEHLKSKSLNQDHGKDWLRRVRNKFSDRKIKHFFVGEYGDETGRPHFHAVLFNVPTCVRGRTWHDRPEGVECCTPCKMVQKTWKYGRIELGPLDHDTARYCAGYTVKKMTHADDFRLDGRTPEYVRMSNRPKGIGYDALHEIASQLLPHEQNLVDVPVAIKHGPRSMPLGRYLRRELRQLIGREKNAPSETLQEQKAELQVMRQASQDSQKEDFQPVSKIIFSLNHGRELLLEYRQKREKLRNMVDR